MRGGGEYSFFRGCNKERGWDRRSVPRSQALLGNARSRSSASRGRRTEPQETSPCGHRCDEAELLGPAFPSRAWERENERVEPESHLVIVSLFRLPGPSLRVPRRIRRCSTRRAVHCSGASGG